MKSLTILKLTLAATGLATIVCNATGAVGTWSVQTNTNEWNQALGVTFTRQGCSEAPASCVRFISGVAASHNVKVSLVIPLNATTTVPYALEYSRASLTTPALAEVTIDDFRSQYQALFTSPFVQPAAVVAGVITNLKASNPRLLFGATIYEDDLTNAYLQNSRLPAAIRAHFDIIHLFIHYRGHGPNYAAYVQEAKQLFPNAHIFAGSYAYDRRAFFPCLPGGQPCSVSDDISLFEQSLQAQVQLMSHGAVAAIEFYPGYFGAEDTWTGWSNPRECDPSQVAECIANTQKMRAEALGILRHQSSVPVWGQLAPTGPLPLGRAEHSAAIDSASHRMIVFGGDSGNGLLNDTWILANADGRSGQPAWIPVATATAPPASYYSQGMYDPSSNRMMLYGGSGTSDVWILTNANGLGSTPAEWLQLSTTGLQPDVFTSYESQVYDPLRNVMIVYDSTAGVWTLSHANGLGGASVWTQLDVPLNGPPARAAFTAVYNPSSNRMIVFGGSDGTTDFNDMWVLTNANGQGGAPAWIPLPLGTATAPAGREGHTAVYDPASDTMTIFGGIGQPSDTWSAAHASGLTQPPVWTLVNPGVPFEDPRTFETAVLDTNSFSMIVFGGINTQFLNTVIVLSPL